MKELGDIPILVSACLAGCECRFDGAANTEDAIARLVADGRAVMVCPEEEGGLGTPRPRPRSWAAMATMFLPAGPRS